jgi:hypothetical protein
MERARISAVTGIRFRLIDTAGGEMGIVTYADPERP